MTPGSGWLAMVFADEVTWRRMEWKAKIRRAIKEPQLEEAPRAYITEPGRFLFHLRTRIMAEGILCNEFSKNRPDHVVLVLL